MLAQIAGLSGDRAADPTSGVCRLGSRMLAEEPQDEEAVQQLERLSTQSGEYGELAQIFEQRLETASDPEVQRGFALKLAGLYETHPG
jgi:hypothetical protein